MGFRNKAFFDAYKAALNASSSDYDFEETRPLN